MYISNKDGIVRFDNLTLSKGLTEEQFTKNIRAVKVEQIIDNNESKTYSVLYAWTETTPFSLAVVFNRGIIVRITVYVGHPNETWDDDTPEQRSKDANLLKQLLIGLWHENDLSYVFTWGKVDLTQDWKNSFTPCLTIDYSPK